MIKKFLLLSLVASQLMISCSSDETPETTDPVVVDPPKELTLEEEIANIAKQPYSALTPAQQKVKLEAEANEMLVQLDKTKSSGAIEALENLGRLLDLSSVDIFDGKSGNGVEDILQVSGVYGIYTWNSTQKIWVKTTSSTELKFVFPAKSSQTTNNASFSAKSVSSDIKVKFEDSYGYWTYNEQTQQSVYVPAVNDHIFLPTSADAVLTIDSKEAATFTQTAKYANGKEVPTDFAYKMTLNDGYTWGMSSTKAVANTAKASLTYNGKSLIDFNSGSNAEIDKLMDNDELIQYRGKANGLIKLMDNFVIVANMDLATEAADKDALYKNNIRPQEPNYQNPDSNFKTYYNSLNAYELKISEGLASNFNKNMNLILVSKKDGAKIATIVQHSQKDGEYNSNLPVWITSEWYENGGYWGNNGEGEAFSQPYLEQVYYLKFNDNTEVEMSAYFSEGFTSFEAKFEDFIAAFNK
ncbi:hypothetical protein Q1W71_20780 [Flavobacterium pectinovorum]|uniref:hypothetical protein n=1 Tax=Flavobacterium pectinovorum TaxID=29533 RepID=UPI00265F7505|nr:hypothetical protein [Flavobacterium pectinovorum]WKL47383.1 hypothetical protein Q1W71_20780 [Flavobacterium pectinovorum]